MHNKKLHKLFCLMMTVCIVSVFIPPAKAGGNTITISGKEDFIEFAKNCTLDTWSQDKTINLTCDIDFTNSNFSPVPTFGGTFNGNGYTISGIDFSNSGSYIGLFRYVQANGKVKDINVKATIAPNGSKSYIGGICGENNGVLELCNFDGTIKGQNLIGGICGNNNGRIVSCNSYGSITGENFTGGICGKNSGFIQDCTNNAAVNTIYEEKKNEISDIDTDGGAIIENIKNSSEEDEESSVLGHSDTGGITGYSSGIIQGCTNNCNVGYPHIGYNIGGIAGRQSGYVLGCENNASIYGRKDVGGIVGQAEPYILLQASEGGLKNIKNELTTLNTMLNRFITDTDDLGTDAEKSLTDISQYSQTAQDNAELLVNQGTDFIDDNLDEINAQSAILSNTLDNLTPAFESLENSGENVSSALDKIIDALDNEELYFPDFNDEIEEITDALDEISKAQSDTKKAVLSVKTAGRRLESAVKFDDEYEVKRAVSDMSDSIKDIIKLKQSTKSKLEEIKTILQTKPDNFDDIGIKANEAINAVKQIAENTDTSVSALKTIQTSLDTIILNTEINFSKFKSAAKNIEDAVVDFGDAMDHITSGIGDLGNAIDNFSDKSDEYSDDMTDAINSLKDDLSDSLTALSYATDDITKSLQTIKDVLNDLSNEEAAEFVKLGDDFKSASENLFNSLSDISEEIDNLKNTFSDKKTPITNNLHGICNQFDLIMNLLTNEVESIQDETASLSDIFLDVSDEDIESTSQGKISQCYNSGTIEADRNIGGITGSMAIEYAKDPEDDIEKPSAFNFTYRTKAILHNCINDGKVSGKKDCIGGIVGLSELGTVYGCQNYADTESTNGNYVGGVVGKSSSSVRKSYAKCDVTGKRYIGGIVGKADTLTACYAIANVYGDENLGAICGAAVDTDKLYKNFYIDNGCGAIDAISYSEKGMSITYDELKNISSIPTRFIGFTVTFIADDKTIEVQEIRYGDDTAKIKYPQIPQKDGHFGNWQKPSAETVTENIEILCVYEPYITILASEERNDNGKLSLALAEGEFDDKAVLHITSSSQVPPVNNGKNIKTYDIALCNTDIQDSETVTLRILNENKDNTTVWILNGDDWEKVKTTDRGKYVILSTTGTRNTICVSYTQKGFNFLWIIPIILIIGLLIFFLLKKHSHKNFHTED